MKTVEIISVPQTKNNLFQLSLKKFSLFKKVLKIAAGSKKKDAMNIVDGKKNNPIKNRVCPISFDL